MGHGLACWPGSGWAALAILTYDVYVPVAALSVHGSGCRRGGAEQLRRLTNSNQANLAAANKLKTQGTGAEEESVPRYGQQRRERFEQRNAPGRIRAHFRNEVRNRAGSACHG